MCIQNYLIYLSMRVSVGFIFVATATTGSAWHLLGFLQLLAKYIHVWPIKLQLVPYLRPRISFSTAVGTSQRRASHPRKREGLCFRKRNVNATNISDIQSCCFTAFFLLVSSFPPCVLRAGPSLCCSGLFLVPQVGCVSAFLRYHHSWDRSFWYMDEFGFITILLISFPPEFCKESKDFARN